MRPAFDVTRISWAFALFTGAIAVTSGCAPVAYRVPGIEVQRLAWMDPAARGDEVRVVPRTAPLMPAMPPRPVAAPPRPRPPVAATPPPEAAAPPLPPLEADDQVPPPLLPLPAVDDEEPGVGPARPFDTRVNVIVDVPVDVDVRVRGPVRPVRVAPAYAVRPAPAPRLVTSVPGGGGGGGWRGAPVSAPVRSSPGRATFAGGHRTSIPHFSAGHHSGGHGGGGGNGAAAAVVGVVAVVGLVAAVAVAADHADRVQVARNYDGWVAVAPDHPVHLHYRGSLVRVVALSDLRMEDTIGLQYAVLRASEGQVQHLGRATGASASPPSPPEPPPPPPPYSTSP